MSRLCRNGKTARFAASTAAESAAAAAATAREVEGSEISPA